MRSSAAFLGGIFTPLDPGRRLLVFCELRWWKCRGRAGASQAGKSGFPGAGAQSRRYAVCETRDRVSRPSSSTACSRRPAKYVLSAEGACVGEARQFFYKALLVHEVGRRVGLARAQGAVVLAVVRRRFRSLGAGDAREPARAPGLFLARGGRCERDGGEEGTHCFGVLLARGGDAPRP